MTNGDKINTAPPKPPQILIAPLDWGLGHATRCIPIINYFINKGCIVILAAGGKQAELLTREFPALELLPLPGYHLNYSSNSWKMKWKIFFQSPKILTSIKRENQWLAMNAANRKIDMVISDCRFGLHHPNIYCVLITHQLRIKSPFGKWTESVLQKWNYRFIDRFNECWVPDFKQEPNLAGELSHPGILPRKPVKYIGGLSRFSETVCNDNTAHFDLLIVLSGPEPQRSILEQMMLKELKSFAGKAAIVRGLPGEETTIAAQANLAVFNHLPSDKLCALIKNSDMVISRSGYTTVMDIMKLKKKSILIPTPGQTEQEYLGAYLMQQRLCVCVLQDQFSLQAALQQASSFEYADINFDMELYQSVIEEVLKTQEKERR